MRSCGPAIALLFLLPLVTVSCARNEQTTEDADKAIRSWQATLRLATDQWISGRVPDTYFDQVLRAAREDLASRRKKLNAVPSAGTDRPRLDVELTNLDHRISELSSAFEHSDTGAARSALANMRRLPGGGSG